MMKIFKELSELGYESFTNKTIDELDKLHVLSDDFKVEMAMINHWLLKNHNIYIVVLPTVNLFWTYKILIVNENEVETPPYKNVHKYDYTSHEMAMKNAIEEVIETIKETIY